MRILPAIGIVIGLSGCSYLEQAAKQAHLFTLQKYAPAQRVYKHMLEGDNYFVFGKVKNATFFNREALAVVAISNLYQKNEVVDIGHFSGDSAYYGLNLPAGDFHLLVLSDVNGDGWYDDSEVVGERTLSLDSKAVPEKVLGGFDIDLGASFSAPAAASLHLQVARPVTLAESLFYPKGSIRSLDDDIFSPDMASLGMYEPAGFLEKAPMMFYALEEDLAYKVPVVFVHGIDGSARDFKDIVASLDRTRYRPWFFYYPSGNDLGQLGEMFYKIFLSGTTIPVDADMPMIIVAHSMGGLVVRDALNRYSGKKGENSVRLLVTIASPLAGHPAARYSSQGPVVLPSWRDIAPESEFIIKLRRKKLPKDLQYHLIYAFGNTSSVKLGENSDGVVPLSSQLSSEAQDESTLQYGFNDSHTGILHNSQAIDRILKLIEGVKSPFPDDHLRELFKGGYQVDLGDDYSPIGKYCIRMVGHWMDALTSGSIAPIHPFQAHFVEVFRGRQSPDNPVEKAWARFIAEYPDRSGL
jgi:uncharacterized alpha/beta hydrolase family protein